MIDGDYGNKKNCKQTEQADIEVVKARTVAYISLAVAIVLSILMAAGFLDTDKVLTKFQTDIQQLEDDVHELKTVKTELVDLGKSEVICEDCQVKADLKNCPLCGSVVKCLPVEESWHIKCPECKLSTGYYDTLESLLVYWNNRELVNEIVELPSVTHK